MMSQTCLDLVARMDRTKVLAFVDQMQCVSYDGVPRTRHMITNVLIDVDVSGTSGSCKSYVQVLHQGPGGPLHPVVAGTYHDKVHVVEGRWLFAERLMEMQLIGDLSTHVHGNPLKKF